MQETGLPIKFQSSGIFPVENTEILLFPVLVLESSILSYVFNNLEEEVAWDCIIA